MHDAYIGGRFQQTKITCKASDATENLQPDGMCCLVLPPEIVMHDTYIGRRSENNIKCVVHDDHAEEPNNTL